MTIHSRAAHVYAAGSATVIDSAGAATLLLNTVYYLALAGDMDVASLWSMEISWDATILITLISLEDTNYSVAEVGDHVTDVKWVPDNPTGASVGATSGTVSGATVAVTPAGTAGSALWIVGNAGVLRTRWKLAVGATGGVINFRSHLKA